MIEVNDRQTRFMGGFVFLFFLWLTFGIIVRFLLWKWPNLFVASPAIQTERIGIIFQLLAGLSIIPELAKEGHIKRLEKQLHIYRVLFKNSHPIKSFYDLYAPLREVDFIFGWIFIIYFWILMILWWFTAKNDYPGASSSWSFKLLYFIIAFSFQIPAVYAAEFFVRILYRVLNIFVKLGFRRTLIYITFPFFIIGTILQLISTFMI